jgi:hypothetical protein
MRNSVRDLLAGLASMAFGLAFAIASLGYDLGTALRMGPGYFPLALGCVLALLGLVIAAKGLTDGGREVMHRVPWRALLLLLGAPIFFGLTIKGLGLGPTLFVTVMMSALASREMTIGTAMVLALLLTVFCVAIFVYGLSVSVPVIGPWLSF